jgi:HEAT repeat protein
VSDAVDRAIEDLLSEHADDVAEAMEVLRSRPEAHDAVLDALSHHESSQEDLARLLGEWGRPESVGVLVDAVRRGEHPLRYAAAMALAEHSDPLAVRALDELAGSDDPDVAHMAALARDERAARG